MNLDRFHPIMPAQWPERRMRSDGDRTRMLKIIEGKYLDAPVVRHRNVGLKHRDNGVWKGGSRHGNKFSTCTRQEGNSLSGLRHLSILVLGNNPLSILVKSGLSSQSY